MYIAHIGPTSTLHLLEDEKYQLAIASHILEDAAYADFYRHVRGFVMLDVPTYETKGSTQYSVHDLVEAVHKCAPHEVVLPDVWDIPWEDNVVIAKEAAGHLAVKTRRGIPNFMVIPHATNLIDYMKACDELLSIDRVTTIGIAKRVEIEMQLPRINVLQAVRTAYPFIPVHLMGCLRDMDDVNAVYTRMAARSMDTAKFIGYGIEGLLPTHGYLPEYKGRNGNYFTQEVTATQIACIQKNIAYWDKFCERM